MKKFIRSQVLQSITNDITDTELLGIFPSSYSTCTPTSLTSFIADDCQLVSVLKLSHSQLLIEECSYKDIGLTKLLPPVKESVFDHREHSELISLYKQLHPNYTVEYVPPFYICSGRLCIGCDIIGSTCNNRSAKSSSVIAAYWPTSGNSILPINSLRKSIGKVCYFFSHTIKIRHLDSDQPEDITFTMACVDWMDYHEKQDLFGISATVCANMTKPHSLCSFIPVLITGADLGFL